LNITSLLLVVLFDYTTLLISYTHNGDDTHKNHSTSVYICHINTLKSKDKMVFGK